MDAAQIAASIGSVGDALDNAMIESGNGLHKTECIRTAIFHAGAYKTLADVEFATAGWVDWYNNRRLHSAIGDITPLRAEQAYYAALAIGGSRYSSGAEPVPVQFVQTARRYHTVEIQAGATTMTAAQPLPEDLQRAIDAIRPR